MRKKDSGRIWLNGKELDIKSPRDAIDNKIGLLTLKDTEEYNTKLRTKTPTWETRIMNLSGGNQQKVLLARWLLTKPDLLIVDEPTRGIDVGAKSEIHELLSRLAGEGKAIIVISSEMPEVMGISDRIVVMHEGEMTGVLNRDQFSQELLMRYATGGSAVEELKQQSAQE